MKSVIFAAFATLVLAACGSTPTKTSVEPVKAVNSVNASVAKPFVPVVHEQTVGAVRITYDDAGTWIKIVSSGTAPTHNSTSHAISEATKVAAMHAKQNIAEFMSSDLHSNRDAKITSKSKVHSSVDTKDNTDEESAANNDSDVETLTTVIEHIKENSAAILRGVYVTERNVDEDSVNVEVTVTYQSIVASRSLQEAMGR